MVALADLKPAPYNPPRRTTPKALKALIDSLDLLGLLSPITVSPGLDIIDGHRRVAAARALNWLQIECNVVEQEATAVYASVNVTARLMSGNDALCVWLACPTAAPARLIPAFNAMETVLGREMVERIARQGLSLRVYKTARSICRYCDDLTPATIVKMTAWLIEFPVIGQVMKAMDAGVSPRSIMDAVRRNRPVKISLEVN
jgi:hypothetical protein